MSSFTSANDIISHLLSTSANTVQLVDLPEPDVYEQIKLALPEVDIVQVLHVMDFDIIETVLQIENHIDYFLLDLGNPGLKTKVLGGTGKTHNWEISTELVRKVNKPVFLVGSLNPQNARDAIEKVQPYGIDICSGLRDPNFLLEDKLKELMKIVSEIGNKFDTPEFMK